METNILRELDHPNIIKMYEAFEDNENVYLVMEVCEGGELFYMIEEKGKIAIILRLFSWKKD